MRLVRQIIAITVTAFTISLTVNAADFNKQELTQKFEKLGVSVTDIKPADIDGLIEVHTNRGVLFSSRDGSYFINGTMYQFNTDGSYHDVIAKRQAPINAQKLNALTDDMIVYKAEHEKYVVTVFTDITCGYCIKMHSQIQQYNDLGITVRYLAFPRQGGKSQVADQMASIWCADDPVAALDTAKNDHKLPSQTVNLSVCQKKIEQQYELGREVGVAGTPAVFLPNGMMVGGYLPPEQLLQRLQNM